MRDKGQVEADAVERDDALACVDFVADAREERLGGGLAAALVPRAEQIDAPRIVQGTVRGVELCQSDHGDVVVFFS